MNDATLTFLRIQKQHIFSCYIVPNLHLLGQSCKRVFPEAVSLKPHFRAAEHVMLLVHAMCATPNAQRQRIKDNSTIAMLERTLTLSRGHFISCMIALRCMLHV